MKSSDIIEGVKSRKIASVGMDVYEHEKDLFFEDRSDEVFMDDQFSMLNYI